MTNHEHRWGTTTEHVGGYVVAACTVEGCTTAKTVPYIPRGPKEHQVDMPQYMLDAGHFEGLDTLPYSVGVQTDPIAIKAANVIIADLAQQGGGTYEQGTFLPFTPKVGYAVGIGGVQLPATIVTPEAVLWAARITAKEFNTSFVGTWLNEGIVHFDAVEYFGPERRQAAIVRGIEAGQLAIYDFAAGEAINIAYTTEDHDR